ncbi:PIR protein [Plasmodium vivax]|uniref:VIR protein n=1 Tax=Plasmodium vivax TaxID=5855 RepID=A0A565A3S0_PLAVI|nr:PIR protein [Plasmodium vivax]
MGTSCPFLLYLFYPFLNTVWNTYNQFDNSVDDDPDKYKYDGFCNPLMEQLGDDNIGNKKFCLKLVRNLGRYSENFKFKYFTSEYFTNLNNWVYNSIKKYNIPENIIVKCYQDYIDFMSEIHIKPICYYYSYDNMYEEPINIIILKIFENNMNVIESTLDRAYDSMNLPYEYNKKGKATCDMLNIFKTMYDSFLLGKSYKNYKIPSLDNDEVDYLTMCQPDTPRSALAAERPGTISVLQPKTQDGDGISGAIPSLSPVTGENQGISMSSTVSTAFGTVAGASSILALLYKFTPGRKWINSGFRGVRGRTSSNIYDEPNELLFDGMEHNGFNSYNIGYEAI